ncbi:MAG TPA: hypothetical protein QF597_03855, partial [Arenicellales bacterium]|nr:hypothetical protein [Arenicellales bacterium]
MATITKVTLTEFAFTMENIGLETAAAGVGNVTYVPGGNFAAKRFAVAIETDQDVRGEYVVSWVGT